MNKLVKTGILATAAIAGMALGACANAKPSMHLVRETCALTEAQATAEDSFCTIYRHNNVLHVGPLSSAIPADEVLNVGPVWLIGSTYHWNEQELDGSINEYSEGAPS